MYVFLDAKVENLTNLYSLLKSYNVEPQKGVVVETDASKYTQYPIYLLPLSKVLMQPQHNTTAIFIF